MFNENYSELIMCTLYPCLMKIFRLVMWTHHECLINYIQSWSSGPSKHGLMKSSRAGQVDPLCMFNENIKSLVMWTLYACFMKDIRSWSCGPSLHP